MRYSKQREAVYQVLRNTVSHPDVSWIYSKTREIIPNISLATVYRNLDELLSIGKVKKVSVEGFADRYDANVCTHAHKACERCGAIADIDMDGVSISHNIDGVSRYEVTFYGICDECRKNTKGGNSQ